MTEITRVPLKPVGKGALAKLWIGIALAVAVALGLAYGCSPQAGYGVTTVKEGSGPVAKVGDIVFAEYVGKLDDGTEFDRSQPLPFETDIFPDGVPFPVEEGATVPGFFEGLQEVQTGGEYVLKIPADKAYGDEPPPGSPVPPGADLTFDLKVNEIMSQEQFQQRMQQLIASQQPPGGQQGDAPAPNAAPKGE